MDYFSEIRQSFESIKNKKAEGDIWGFDEEPLSVFESTFEPVLGGITINEMVSNIRSRKGNVRATNLLGGRKVLEELGVDEGFSVRLLNKNSGQEDNPKVKTIAENILSRKTWEQIPDDQDLILSIGRAAYIRMPVGDEVAYWMLNQAWRKLAVGGVMLLQADLGRVWGLESIIKAVKNVDGVTMRVHKYVDPLDTDTYFAIFVEKGENAPKDFPSESVK